MNNLNTADTLRKVKRRGWEPVRWRSEDGAYNGFIVKRARKYLHCYFIALGRKRLPLVEERHMTELD